MPDRATALSRVLIVGDDETIPEAFLPALHDHGLSVDLASDGLAALAYVREHEYAVILVDVMMPRMDGKEFLRAYGEIRRTRRAVVFVVTECDDRILRKFDSALVHARIRKPFDAARLSLMIRDCAALFDSGPSAALPDERRGLRLVQNP